MRFAVVNNIRTEAEIGLSGFCPLCSQPVIAKCGQSRIWHWAHRNIKKCDNWVESETEWHRSWKKNFPTEWQEYFFSDERTGEKHMADVRTKDNLVIEFQHSHLEPVERASRENFYQNMIWVVDGTRLKRDFPRFQKGKSYFQTVKPGIFRINSLEEHYSQEWLGSSVPVIFDFLGTASIENSSDIRSKLYCLFPVKIGSSSFIAEISRKTFINTTINGEWSLRAQAFIEALKQVRQEWQDLMDKRQRIQNNINFERFIRATRCRQRRNRL